MKIIVTTHPFGDPCDKPIQMLNQYDVEYNTKLRKYSKAEHIEVLKRTQPDIIIAGTEQYDEEILDLCPNLKMISRVGIGLDSVDLAQCSYRGIVVTYTPEAPSNAVAELTVCQMLNGLRRVEGTSTILKDGGWKRYIGRELRGCDIGIIGFGRIGNLVAEKLQGLKPRRLFINDLIKEKCINIPRCEYASKLQILSDCDIITIHIPYNKENRHYIDTEDFSMMKSDAVIINTSRGGIVNETALHEWLTTNPKAFAAVDTFIEEPYKGDLILDENTSLTPHLGSCSEKSRLDMELGATVEALNFIKHKPFINKVC